MGLSHMTLSDYYQTILNMSKEHHYSLSDLDNMIPYEIELFTDMIALGERDKGQRFNVDDF